MASNLLETVLRYYLNKEYVEKFVSINQLNLIDPRNLNEYLPLNNVNIGFWARELLNDYREKNPFNKDELNHQIDCDNLVLNCRIFCQELCVQLQKRFDFSDLTLRSFSALNPNSKSFIFIH